MAKREANVDREVILTLNGPFDPMDPEYIAMSEVLYMMRSAANEVGKDWGISVSFVHEKGNMRGGLGPD